MAVQILPYDVKNYNSLPSIWDASIQLGRVCNRAEAFNEIAQVFLKHQVQDALGIILLHNHFPMETGQKLVSLGNVATPWDANIVSEHSTNITGTSFRFLDGAVTPYEFSHGVDEIPLEKKDYQVFLVKLLAIFEKWGLKDVLGICLLPDIGEAIGTEFTCDNVNVTLPVDLHPMSGTIDAMWHFGHASVEAVAIATESGPVIPVIKAQCKARCRYAGPGAHRELHLRT
ncbi:hypothetical protein V8C44DRAFT_358396 [Trichoderma aethiopicum]